MYLCRLFHRDRPTEQIDARLMTAGSLTLGRDPATDWPLEDPEGLLSRIHCTLSIDGGALLLCDCSTNGTFIDGGVRAPRGVATPLAYRQTVSLGGLTLVVDEPVRATDIHATLIQLPPAMPAAGWDDAPPHRVRAPHPDASLLEAFCEGAHLDASMFAGDDPVFLMRRLGGIYQQTILGLSALMSQRAAMKAEHALDRTTVTATDNNPVKWSGPRRLAQDLLRPQQHGFCEGDEAVRASFVELAEHLTGITAAANAAIATILDMLDPDVLATLASEQASLLRGKAAAQIDLHRARHQALRATLIEQAFRDAYGAMPAAAAGPQAA